MAPVTPEEMLDMLAEQDRRMRELLADQDRRTLRMIKAEVQPLKDQAQRIEIQVKATNGRVTNLEAWRIASDSRKDALAEAAATAAALVARQAADVISARERSRRWWLGVITAWGVAIASISTLASLLANYLNH